MSQTVREVVVAAYGRTGIAKARKGGLHLTHPVDFTGQLLAGVVRKVPQLAVSEIDDVVLGCARRFSRDEDEESCTRLYSPLCVGAGVTVGAGVAPASPLVR